MSSEERAARACRLREFVENDDVKDAIASVDADLTEAWKNCHDGAQREALWWSQHALGLLRAKLTAWSTSDISALKRGK
jgi:hypothetical protein